MLVACANVASDLGLGGGFPGYSRFESGSRHVPMLPVIWGLAVVSQVIYFFPIIN